MSAKFVIDDSGQVHMAVNTRLQWETLCKRSAGQMADARGREDAPLCVGCTEEYDEIQAQMASRLALPGGGSVEEIKAELNQRYGKAGFVSPFSTAGNVARILSNVRTFLYGS